MFRKLHILFSLIILISIASSTPQVLLDDASIYLASGESYGLYQGYVITLKAANSDGLIWIQLFENDKIIKDSVVKVDDYFIYNKSNMTIISMKVNNVYAGISEQNLVSFYPVNQYLDTELPEPPNPTETPEITQVPIKETPPLKIYTPMEPIVWTLGIVFILILFYIIHKLW